MTQEDLGHRSGLDRSYTGGIERGEHNVSLANILKVAGALDVPTTALFQRYEELARRRRSSPT
jgi:transcriptional regulator with XRE-family HTH domain